MLSHENLTKRSYSCPTKRHVNRANNLHPVKIFYTRIKNSHNLIRKNVFRLTNPDWPKKGNGRFSKASPRNPTDTQHWEVLTRSPDKSAVSAARFSQEPVWNRKKKDRTANTRHIRHYDKCITVFIKNCRSLRVPS